jgi:RimJ/RimL family protein N-acetyltransferase
VDERRKTARRALASVPINAMFAQAALDLGAPLWSDREADARAFHVVHPYGMSFVWGPAVDEAFPLVVSHLTGRHAGEEWLQVEPRWTGLGWDDAFGVPDASSSRGSRVTTTRHTRVNFAFDEAAHAERRGTLVPPDGWVARRATAEDFGWPGSVVPSRFWADAEAFLENGGGVVLAHDDEVGAMAFASYRQGSRVELGIETAPLWRRRGLAAAAATAMIEFALDAGLVPVWSCREDNVGSLRLATGIGFAPTTRTPYYHLVASG